MRSAPATRFGSGLQVQYLARNLGRMVVFARGSGGHTPRHYHEGAEFTNIPHKRPNGVDRRVLGGGAGGTTRPALRRTKAAGERRYRAVEVPAEIGRGGNHVHGTRERSGHYRGSRRAWGSGGASGGDPIRTRASGARGDAIAECAGPALRAAKSAHRSARAPWRERERRILKATLVARRHAGAPGTALEIGPRRLSGIAQSPSISVRIRGFEVTIGPNVRGVP